MITDIIKLDSSGKGDEEALDITEKAGNYGNLAHQDILRLRLLSEELIGMLRGIAGKVDSEFWLENKGYEYFIHVKSVIELSKELREQLISASTSGKNAASAGFMGKIRDFISVALLPSKEYDSVMNTAPFGFMAMGCEEVFEETASYQWTLQTYKESLDKSEEEDKKEEWDELEKSIVGSIADDVQVSVKGYEVEITIIKKF